MPRDSQRYRKTYSYYRVQPKTDSLEIIVDETLDWKKSVRYASTASVSLSGSTPLSLDGNVLTDEDRVLLKNQGASSENGIYYYEVDGSNYTLTRASDANQGKLSCGATTYVEEGSVNSGKIFIMSTTGDITVDSTSLTWTEFTSGGGGGGGSSPEYWVSSTSDNLYTTGSTGIGTNDPLGAKLYVSSSLTGSAASALIVGGQVYGVSLNIYKAQTHLFQTANATEAMRINSSANIGIGTATYTSRLFVSGSSTASSPTLTVKEGQPTSFGTPILEVQNSLGTSLLYITGNLATVGGRVGIGTTQPNAKLHVSSSYGGSSHGISIGQPNILGLASNTYTSSQHTFFGGDGTSKRFVIDDNGNVILGGELPGLVTNTTRLLVTGSSTSTNRTLVVKAGVPSPTGPLLDIQDYAGNSIVFVSGSGLSGSLTKLTDGTSYLRAGTNITISTGSNGAVTIEASGGSGPTGSGTDGYLAQWSGGTTVLGDSFVRNFNSDIAKYMKKEHWFEDSAGGSYVYIKSNSTDTGRIGINVNPSFALDIIAGANSINEAVRVRNNNAAQGTGLRQTFIAGNYSEPTFRITHAWPSNAEGHYTFFGITKPTPSAGTPSIAERLKLYSSGSVEVSGSLVARLDPEIINKPVLSAQKANGTEVMWVSSSAGTNTVGTDVFMWVSGSRTTDNTGADKVVFGGDVRISGSLSVGTGSVLLTSNDVQFGSSGMRIQKSGNDMKFFDINNSGGLTLSELAAGGGGSSPTYWTSSTNGQVYATGSVGIGTTSPADRLSVHNGGQDRVGANISSAVSSLYMGSNINTEGVTSIEYDRSAGKLHFKYGSTGSPLSTAVSIKTADGNVGIGNTSPTTKLFVESASGVQIEATNGTVSQRVGYCLSGVGYSGTSTNHPYSLLVNDSEKMRIDTSGNVGVGTGTISAKLHVSGSSTGNTPTILARHGIANGSSLPVLNVQNSSGDSLLWVSGSGYVGIGTSGASAVTNTLKGLGGNVVSIHGAFASSLLFEIDGNLSGAINNSNSGMVVVPGANRSLGLGSDNSVKMVVETDGDVNIQTSNRYFDASISSGQGIRLRSSPGNSDAQVLDCYSESSITVTLTPETGSLSLDSAHETLEVTRIGRTVNICGTLVCDGGLGQDGHLQINVDGALSGMLPMVDTAVAVYLDDWSGDWATSFGHPQAYINSTNGNIHISRLADGNAEPIAIYCVTSSVIKVMVTYVAAV